MRFKVKANMYYMLIFTWINCMGLLEVLFLRKAILNNTLFFFSSTQTGTLRYPNSSLLKYELSNTLVWVIHKTGTKKELFMQKIYWRYTKEKWRGSWRNWGKSWVWKDVWPMWRRRRRQAGRKVMEFSTALRMFRQK